MSAVSSPHTKAPAPSRTSRLQPQPPVERLLAEKAARLGLADRLADAPDRVRVLGADVEDPLLGADGVGGDGQPLDHAVGVGLEHQAVHERAGVALVAVADHVATERAAARARTHLRPVGKPAPPRPRRPEAEIASITSLRREPLDAGPQRRVAAVGEGVVEAQRVESAAVLEHDAGRRSASATSLGASAAREAPLPERRRRARPRSSERGSAVPSAAGDGATIAGTASGVTCV